MKKELMIIYSIAKTNVKLHTCSLPLYDYYKIKCIGRLFSPPPSPHPPLLVLITVKRFIFAPLLFR